LIGRRFGKNNKWPFQFCKDKSIAGTMAFFFFSTVACIGITSLMIYTNSLFHLPKMGISTLCARISLLCFLSAIVELLPLGNDNVSVPLFAAIATRLLIK